MGDSGSEGVWERLLFCTNLRHPDSIPAGPLSGAEGQQGQVDSTALARFKAAQAYF